jgi:hypothetical protein
MALEAHLENNVLFPAALEIEWRLRSVSGVASW